MKGMLTVAGLLAGCFASASWTRAAWASGPPDSGSGMATVHGRVTQTRPYCGGAAPSPEMLKRLAHPEPFTEPLHVMPGHENTGQPDIAVLRPEIDSRFSLELPPGEYCVIRESRQKMSVAGSRYTDAACLRQYRQACDAVWKVNGLEVEGSLSIQVPCFGPCYRGPMPP
jgi:hypothetical protein